MDKFDGGGYVESKGCLKVEHQGCLVGLYLGAIYNLFIRTSVSFRIDSDLGSWIFTLNTFDRHP